MIATTSPILLKNTRIEPEHPLPYAIHRSVIHILFTAEHPIHITFGPRKMELPPFSNYLFYEQDRDFGFPVSAPKSAPFYSLEIPIEALHQLLSKGVEELDFSHVRLFEQERYHKLGTNSEQINICLHSLEDISNPLLKEAKKLELLSHYFTAPDVQQYSCPFLHQKDNVDKVRKAKAYLISDLRNAPTIRELAKTVGLNEHHLKTGFKEIYGKPVHTFLKDHRMMEAKRLIDSREFKVNEVAEQMGYSNVSHFIEAFRKKFGQTPKKYELSRQ